MICFVGNCQTVGLAYFLKRCVPDQHIVWCCYGEEFLQHLGSWTQGVEKLTVDDESIAAIAQCDVLVYQRILPETSPRFHTQQLLSYCSPRCVTISVSSAYLEVDDLDASLEELARRDVGVDIRVSELVRTSTLPPSSLFLSRSHPSTALFMMILRQLCDRLGLPFFRDDDDFRATVANHPNMLGLPE